MILTGLAPDPRRPEYRLVEVDRGRFASLPAAALTGLDLTIGREISPLVLERLQELADIEAAHRAALRALARRAHARHDLRRRLLQKQHPPGPVDEALARLEAVGLLNDVQFAIDFAAAKARRSASRCRSRIAKSKQPSRRNPRGGQAPRLSLLTSDRRGRLSSTGMEHVLLNPAPDG